MLDVLTTALALNEARMTDRRAGWLVTIGITAMAFVLRVINLGFPHKVMFDETYYAKDAWAILQSGYERKWPDPQDDRNAEILSGDLSSMLDEPSYIVHPPLGKILIGWGEHLFGMDPFGWRIAACVFGALMVFFVIRLARRLSRSTLVGAIAGLLVTFDGLAFVMSRIALLDIFQATFAVAAVAALVADRDWFRHKLGQHLQRNDLRDLGGRYGPLLLWRPWRIIAGIMFGASIAVKWNTLYMVAVFGIVTVIWDLGARRLAGAGNKSLISILGDGVAAFIQLVVVAIPVYLASWSRWLLTDGGWDRQWGAENPEDPIVMRFGNALGSLWHYHVAMYDFHTGDGMLEATHPYEAHPAGWLFMVRPIGIDAENGIESGTGGCEAVGTTCLRVVSAMGTPLLWWLAAFALIAALWFWLGRRDWRFAVPVLAVAAVWLPWFQYAGRPLFFFYAIMIIPFSATALAMVMGKFLGPADGPQRRTRAMAVGIAIALIILNFAFILPVLTDQLLTRPAWLSRMWFGTWI